ncbi:MAG: S8 family serine peptidase [bacterium]
MISILLVLMILPPVPGKITPELVDMLSNVSPQEKVCVIVHMGIEYPYAQIEHMLATEKCDVFKMVAENSQREVIRYIKSLSAEKAELLGRFWIFNGFHLNATKDIIYELAKRDDIWFICYNATAQLDDRRGEMVEPRTPEWNISKIMADSCWAAGYSGAGIIIGHISTGADVNHPAISGKWLSPYWYDAVYNHPAPYDDLGNGTHAIGITCGGDGPGPFVNDIGIAYGAQYIPTKATDATGSAQYVWLDNCMQYLANLKQQGIDIRIISNCWGSNNNSDLHWWNIILNWKNLGILPVFANGNSGAAPGTVISPASYSTVIGVGATNVDDDIASFSSRGPAPNIYPINDPFYWYYPEWNLLKPDISAPGVNIRSAVPNGGYATLNSTTRAAHHIAGGAAILLEKNPNLTVTDLYNLFRNYCDQPSQGAPYPNNNYGWGRINLWRSLQNVPPLNQPFVVLNRAVVVNDNNGNNKLDPGENAGIVCYLKNSGGIAATNVQATLRTTSSYISIIDSTYIYGTINSGDSANNNADPFDISVSASTPPGHIADFQLVLTAVETTWVRNFSLTVGIAPGTIIWGPKSLQNFPTNHYIYGVCYDRLGDRIHVLDFYSDSIRCYSSDSLVTYYGAIRGPEDSLTDISYSPIDDALYVCGLSPKIVWKIDKTTGQIMRQFNNPAFDYPVGLAYHSPDTIWFADRRTLLGATQLIYIGDTLGNAIQYVSPVQGYYNSRCIAYDSLGNSYVQAQTWYNSPGTALDSAGVVEIKGIPPTLTGRRFLLNPGWNIRGIECDPRDGNYWITILQSSGFYVNQIVKVRGFHTPPASIEEMSAKKPGECDILITPNPGIDCITFRINSVCVKISKLKIYDVTGRLVSQLELKKDKSLVKWYFKKEGIAGGIYFAQIEKADGLITRKFILLR